MVLIAPYHRSLELGGGPWLDIGGCSPAALPPSVEVLELGSRV